MQVVQCNQGPSPLILAFPHAGTELPDDIGLCLNENGKVLADTDWHIHRLYDGLLDDVTTVRAVYHRYVIDANRDPAGNSLYPGQHTTSLVPLTDFDGRNIWRKLPDPDDVATRLSKYHVPYHAALQVEIERLKVLNGFAVVFDCHSIRSKIPFLFDGTLPDFNIGTDGGCTCDPAIEKAALAVASQAAGYTHVLNGRFRGGWTTRHSGKPLQHVHAIQMELAQSTYLAKEAHPYDYDHAKADKLRPHLKNMLQTIVHSMTGQADAP